MTPLILSFLVTIVFSLSHAWGVHPNTLIPTSNATCQPNYGWMNGTEQRDPCLTVAYVIAACVGDSWLQPALPPGSSYDPPNGPTATPCYCSWSCYNLMMACTLCQNSSNTNELWDWPAFSQNCSSSYTEQVFPQSYVIADNTSIPYWATINPMNWTSALFNITQAQEYYNQNSSQYYPSAPSPSSNGSGSSANVGAIVGGCVGGAVCFLLILIGGYFVYKRVRRQNASDGAPIHHKDPFVAGMHTHSPSDPSTIFSSQPMTSYQPMSYTTSQPHGVGMGMNVQSPTFHSSYQAVSPQPTDTASFLTTPNTTVQRARAIPII